MALIARPCAAEPLPDQPGNPELGQSTSTCSPSGPDDEEAESKCLDQKLLLALFRPLVGKYPPEKQRQDLTLGNFFSYGWTQGWEEPEEGPDDAPRFRLLRIQRAYWEREVRVFHNYTSGADGGTLDEQELEFELELPISRRFLIEFEPAVPGIRPRGGSWDLGGGDFKVIPEVMLWESQDVSCSSGLVVRTPTGSRSIGEGRTSLTPYLAYWRDLGRRVGLHTYLGAEFPLGGHEPGHPDAILQYAVAPAKTVTPKDTPLLGNLTFFVEFNGTTDLGGDSRESVLTVLPGVRWLLFKDFWLAAGYETPVTGTDAFDHRLWLSLYRDF